MPSSKTPREGAARAAASYQILRPARRTMPVVFASPHSGRDYPEAFVAQSRLGPLALRRSEDCWVDELFARAPDFGAPLLRALFPRAYVDANREPLELDPEMFSDRLPSRANTDSLRVASGLGTIPRVISSGQDIYAGKLPFSEAADRISRCYRPYHDALAGLVRRTRRRFGYCILVDCHSMPSIGGPRDPDPGRGRADVVIGDCFGSACSPCVADQVEKILRGFGYAVHRNQPFAGGYATRHYGDPGLGVHAVQIEINRALYMNEHRIEKTGGFAPLALRMTELIAALAELTSGSMAAE